MPLSSRATDSVVSVDEQKAQDMSSLLAAAERIESPKKKSSITLGKKEGVSDTPLVGISTLLEVAANMVGRPAEMTTGSQGESISKQKIAPTKKQNPPVVARSAKRSRGVLQVPEPSAEELKESSTRRSRNALFSWYARLRDLYEYKDEHGDCLVPQQYPPNRALGIVCIHVTSALMM